MEHLPAIKHTERSIYGIIITASLLITLENHEDSSWDMIVTIFFTLLAVLVAEYYSVLLARGLHRRALPNRSQLTLLTREFIAMLSGSAIPIVIFIFSGLGIIKLLTAFYVAELIVAISLFIYGYIYGRRRGHGRGISLLGGLANFVVVALIVLLKSLFHF